MDVDAPASAPISASSEGKSYAIGTNALHFRKDGMEIENPIEDGLGELPTLRVRCQAADSDFCATCSEELGSG